jgi:hypothetical protein
MKNLLLPVLLFILIPFLSNAQDNTNKILTEIKGKVDEIIIKSEGKEYKFSGEEAEKLFTNMKQNKEIKHFEFYTDDGKVITSDSTIKKIIIKNLNEDDDNDILVYINEDNSDSVKSGMKKIEKKVIVSDDNGKKVVKVTTNENGKENLEVYEGKAADEYLKKVNEKEINIKVNVDKDSTDNKVKKIIIEKEETTK